MILGGGFTQTHQEHSNLSGYNEVAMLRRLPECHKLNACAHIPQLGDDCKQTDQALNMLYDRKIHPNGRQQRPSKVWRTLSKCETLLLWRSACICNVLHLVEMSNIFVDQITKLLSLSFRLKTRPACYDQQGAIACIPEDDI